MASPDQSSTDQEIRSPVDIHKLAKNGNKEEIENVLRDRRQERDIDERDKRGMTPLQYAVINNRPEVVEMLLKETTGKEKKSADYKIIDENGLSLAHYAAKTVRGKTRHAHDICIEGVTESRSDASSSFSSHDRTYCLNLLIKKDKDENGDEAELIYIQDKNHGQTALHYAVMSGSIRSVESLIEADTNKSKTQLIHTPDSNGMRPLHVAATYNQRDIAERLLEKGAELLKQDNTRSTALHYACSNGNLAMVKLLLDKARDKGNIHVLLKIRDNGENTCMHIAAESGHDAIVNLLLDNDATVLIPRRDGMFPLHVAVIGGKVEIVEAILRKSEAWQTHDNANRAHSTPLHLAAQYNRLRIAKLLIEKRNTSVNDKDKDMNTPLHIAAAHGRHRMVCLLMTNGADVDAKNTQGRIPLHSAAERNHDEALKELMRPENETKGKKFLTLSDADRAKLTKELQAVKQFDPSDKDLDVRPALEIVRKYLAEHGLLVDDREPGQRIYNIVRVLEFGKKWNDSVNGRKSSEQSRKSVGSRDSEKGGQPRRLLEREKTIVPKDKVDLLLRRMYMDNIINTEDESGNTALHLAAGNGHTKIVECLLDDFHAEYDRKNDAESTALHLAAQHGHHSTVEVIVKKYPNAVFAEDQNCNTPIHLAAMNGHKETMDILVRRGADVNQINSNKMTALDLAAKFGKVDICDSLVNLEAQNWVDKSRIDVSSLLLACEHGHLEVVKLLLKSVSDFEIKDEDGLNCLDVAIENGQREVARYIINSPHWKVALKNSVAKIPDSKKIDTPMRRLIRNMPDVALDVLDKCSEIRKVPDKKEQDSKPGKKPKYKYNFEFVDDLMTEDGWSFTKYKRDKYIRKQKEIKWTSYSQKARIIKSNHPLSIMVKHKREDLLQHHLVNQLIRTKWWHYGAYYYVVTFLIHLLFLILLTRYILQSTPPNLYNETDVAKILADKCDDLSTNVELNAWLPIEKFLMYFLMILGTVFEIIQMYNMKAAYLNNLESYVEWVVYILSFLFLLESNNCTIETGYRQEWQWSLGAFAIFFVWIDLVLYLKAFTSLGIYVIMFQLVCWTFLKVFIVFFSLITAFALAFHTLVQNKIAFRDVANSILKTSVMFIGELDYEALFNDGVEDGQSTLLYPPALSVLFSIFIIVASIVLMNLLVGLAVDDIKGILLKAAFKRTAMHIELVLDVEKVMNDWLRRKHYLKRDASQNKTETVSESRALWLWRKLKYSKIWWWNQEVDKDDTTVLLTIPERQDKLEKSMESLTRQIADLTKLLKPIIQDGNMPARSTVTQEHKHNGKLH